MDAANQKAKMKTILDRLEKVYGKIRTLPDRPPLEQLLFLLLEEGWDATQATTAFELLQAGYLDWNELRVALPAEVVSTLRTLDPPDVLGRVKRMIQLLEHVFKERNKVTLDYLLEWDQSKRHDYLAKLPMLSPGVTHAFLQQLNTATLLVSPQALRLGGRIGLIPKTTSLNTGRKAFESLLKDTEWARFQLLFTSHGEKICQAKVWYCSDCVINTLCKSSKAETKRVKSGAT